MDPAIADKIVALAVAIAAFPLSLGLTRFFMSWNGKHGIYGVDVHKQAKPRIPEMCGIAMPLTFIFLGIAFALIDVQDSLQVVSFVVVVGIASIGGIVDDLKRMGGLFKPLLGLVSGLPIVIMGLAYRGVYNPEIGIPLFGGFHLPIIYPLVIPIAVSVASNTVNMLDPLNGVMAGGIAIAMSGIFLSVLLTVRSPVPTLLFGLIVFASLGFLFFNKFPSRAFSGNVGQLSLGAALGAAAILGRVEIATIVAIFPNIQNSFFFLSKIRRFTEHRRLTSKPTMVQDDGRIASTQDKGAPLTLVRTIVIGRPAYEQDIVKTIWAIYAIASILGAVTLLLTEVAI